MPGQFSRPVLSGKPLTVSSWLAADDETALFRTTGETGPW